MKTTKLALLEPQAIEYVRVINRNIIYNLLQRKGGSLDFPGLVEKAYVLVNETEDLPYRDFDFNEDIAWR